MYMLGTSFRLKEPIPLWIYLPNFKSNQTWLLHIKEILYWEKQPENGKLYSLLKPF